MKVLKDSGMRTKYGRVEWCCKCDCGNEVLVVSIYLLNGDTKSCGCLKYRIVHGCAKVGQLTPEYRVWHNMKTRCCDSKTEEYPQYGGRGIIVCERWKNSFVEFLKDMGLRPTSKHTIERIDNNGSYSPENCKWATYEEQNRNKRNNHLITYEGKTLCLTEWSEYLSVDRDLIWGRIRRKRKSGLFGLESESDIIANLYKEINK